MKKPVFFQLYLDTRHQMDMLSDEQAGRLIKALLNPEEYRVAYRQDYNGDGNFDADDAVYLQKHASEPENYPVAVK